MAKYHVDLEDIYFNLFDINKIDERVSDYSADDLKDILEQYSKFVEGEVYPTRVPGDEEGVTLKDGQVTTPDCFKKLQKAFYENGWYGLGQSEDIGGIPVPTPLSIACSTLSIGANLSWSMYYTLTQGAMNLLLALGSEEQKNLCVPPMMEGRWGGTMCLTEAGAGSDVGACKTTATPNEDGSYNIKGAKIFISSGENDLYENIVHLVLARTPNAPKGSKGISLFLVSKHRLNESGEHVGTNGVVCSKIEEKMGIHASATCELTFGENEDCVGHLIGDEFSGMSNMFHMMNEARLLCGLQGEGQANLATELTKQYVEQRSQFGVTIDNLPDVRRMVLKMRAMSRGMRAINLYLANLLDFEHEDEKAKERVALLTPVSKTFCTEEGFNTCVLAIQVHGGYGFCSEYGIEQFARDTKIGTIYEGTTGIQALDFTLRKVQKDQAKALMSLMAEIDQTIAQAKNSDWSAELKLMSDVATGIKNLLGKWSNEKNPNVILSHATNFLNSNSYLIVNWLLLKSALLAEEKLAGDGLTDQQKKY
jgi:alkylation response protein AidB-like acyl-CoA dehydrogenase